MTDQGEPTGMLDVLVAGQRVAGLSAAVRLAAPMSGTDVSGGQPPPGSESVS